MDKNRAHQVYEEKCHIELSSCVKNLAAMSCLEIVHPVVFQDLLAGHCSSILSCSLLAVVNIREFCGWQNFPSPSMSDPAELCRYRDGS